MQLLVSVRSAAEVGPALAGGADIIDAKEPRRGPLGPVAPDALSEILRRMPDGRAFSVALGDFTNEDQLVSSIRSLPLVARASATYLKAGFAGVSSVETVDRLLDSAVSAISRHPAAAALVAVAYADRAGSLDPHTLAQRAAVAGAAGVLLDTHLKDGQGLFGWMTPSQVEEWVAGVHGSGLFAAVAGEIGMTDIEAVEAVGADILGVRGAACDGGREGTVAAERVMSLRLRIGPPAFGLSSS